MKSFSYRLLQDASFGMGATKQLPALLKSAGAKHVLLLSDRGLESVGLVQKIQDLITDGGFACTTYLDIEPEPVGDTIARAAEAYRACGANVTVALGGGSPIDAAKAMRLVAKYGGRIEDYEGTGKAPGPVDPLIAIPTTAGTGSEFTNGAVITDVENNFKMVIADPSIAARHVILDPELIMTLPASVAAACGVDALIHAMEAYISKQASPYTDALAEKAMDLIGANIRPFVASRDDEEAASGMLLGSAFAGQALALARLGVIHAMSHPLGAFFHLPHGVANAVLLPAALEYNLLADKGKYAKMYQFITGQATGPDFDPFQLVEACRKLNSDLGIPGCLADLGVTEDKIPAMTADSMKSVYVPVNPRALTDKAVSDIFHRAMQAD